MKHLNKSKSGFEFISNWVLIFFVAILLLSFLLARILINPWVVYLTVLFVGIIFGYFIRKNRSGNRFPYFLLSFAFVSGYLAGHGAGNWFLILSLFIGVMVLTNRIMEAVE